jgi:predicted ABC-type ATPase
MPLMEFAEFDRRPIIVAIAGPNGAGKTTFFHAHLASAGLRFVNADVLAAELTVGAYEAARLASVAWPRRSAWTQRRGTRRTVHIQDRSRESRVTPL